MSGSPSKADIANAKEVANSVVVAQNNRFIKELLRKKGVPIGTKKAVFVANLHDAIDAGTITLESLRTWLSDIEGWGDQHVYLKRVPTQAIRATDWSERILRERAKAAGLGDAWNADNALAFPEEMTLARIQFDGSGLQFTWHAGSESWVRAPNKDIEPREEDGDLYKYHAYRNTGVRSVTRLEVRRNPPLAAIFIPDAWDETKHAELKAKVLTQVAKVLDIDKFPDLLMSEAIKALDAAALNTKQKEGAFGLRARNTRLDAAGAYVEFGSTAGPSYSEVLSVRRVRESVQAKSFTGITGQFEVTRTDENALSRDVRIQLYAKQNRMRLWVAMTSADVWTVLRLIHATCT